MGWQTKELTDSDYNKDGTIRTGMGTIKTQPSNQAYRDGWEKIWGNKKKKKHTTKIKTIKIEVETKDERDSESIPPTTP